MPKGRDLVKVFRERFGKPSKALLDHNKSGNKIMKAIHKELEQGSKTVPEMAAATGLESSKIFWYVNAMRKYKDVIIEKKDGSYNRYALKGQSDE